VQYNDIAKVLARCASTAIGILIAVAGVELGLILSGDGETRWSGALIIIMAACLLTIIGLLTARYSRVSQARAEWDVEPSSKRRIKKFLKDKMELKDDD
jgi:hypothetical protein